MAKDRNSRLVYSTETGRVRDSDVKSTAQANASPFADDGIVRLRRETSGRKGKGVVTVHGVPAAQLKDTAKKLKQVCGSGGAVKDGVIEIQGDKRELIQQALEKAGFQVKLAGG